MKTHVPWLLLILFAGVTAYVIIANYRQSTAPEKKPHFPLPAISESRYLNTGPEAHYIGIDACAECHDARHESYLHTAHSRAFADLDPAEEPPDGGYYHRLSGRSYQVYRKDGEFYHRETWGTGESKALLETALPIRYVVGSGFVTRSYVVEVDGFLHESPITWYTQQEKWHMSPGYDQATHMSFERPIDKGCLNCHTGRVESVGGALNRMKIFEQRIGCESCHGPGSLHRDRHLANEPIEGPDDLTIVNPAKLSRRLGEAICAQCHLRGDATIFLRGRKIGDFRPGLPLSDFRIDYHAKQSGDLMKVVGHVEQMRLSRCYQESKTLTCISCHDPHARSKPEDPAAYFKQKCLTCHTLESCGIEHAQRLKSDAQDNCLACHMPSGNTDIPHIAFTHHRIGFHESQPAGDGGSPAKLTPMMDNDKLSMVDRARNLGLAYLEASYKQKQYADHLNYRKFSLSLLQNVERQGLSDGQTQEALARLFLEKEPDKAAKYAKDALATKGLAPRFRVNAMFIIAKSEMQSDRLDSAIRLFKKVTKLRRHSEDWRLFGECYLKRKQPQKAISTLKYALSINPFRPKTHQLLADAYEQEGQAEKARKHRHAAKVLAENSLP